MANHFIPVELARKYTASFRENKEKITTEEYKNALPNSESFDKDTIQQILDQEGCVGFRVYYGLNDDSEVCVILVGFDEQDQDILANDLIADVGNRCPPRCNPDPL